MAKRKSVSKEEFEAFLKVYPNPLERDVYMDVVTFNDFSLAPKWPDSVVASYHLPGFGETEDSSWQILAVL